MSQKNEFDKLGRKIKKGCSGKNVYSTRSLANRVARDIHRKRGIVMSVYKCPFCHSYHLTSSRMRR